MPRASTTVKAIFNVSFSESFTASGDEEWLILPSGEIDLNADERIEPLNLDLLAGAKHRRFRDHRELGRFYGQRRANYRESSERKEK